MAQPFDFNTPITEQTVLVARYKSTVEEPYAGKWFRLTDQDGQRYIPASQDDAYQWAAVANASQQFYRESDGALVTLSHKNSHTSSWKKIEFGSGWGSYSNNYAFCPPYYVD